MKLRLWPLAGLCLAAGGCGGPPAALRWDDAIDPSRLTGYSQTDAAAAGFADGTQKPAPPGPLDSLAALSVGDAVRIAVAQSPSLRSAGYAVDIAAGRAMQAGAYPNPTLSLTAEGVGAAGGGGGETVLAVEQEIVLGGKIARARAVADADGDIARAAAEAERSAVSARVRGAYFAAVAARDRLIAREELAGLAEGLLAAVGARADAGSATEPDRLRAAVAGAKAAIDRDGAAVAAAAALRTLASAMGLAGTVELPLSTPADELPVFGDPGALASAVLGANGRVAAARLGVERARRVHELARAGAVPDLVVSIGPRYSDIDDETTADLGLAVEVPLFDRNRGAIRAAVAGRLAAAADLRAVQLELLAEVSGAWSAYEAARARAGAYRDTVIPGAERALALTRRSYERGKIDLLRLLDAQEVVVESRIAHIDALERLHEAAALLGGLTQAGAPGRMTPPDADTNEEVHP